MIGFDAVVAVLLGDVRGGRDQFVQHPQVRAGLVGGHLDWRRPVPQGASEEAAGGGGVSLFGQQYVDGLPILVDRAVQVPPAAGDLDAGLINEPAITSSMPERASGVGKQRRESLYPSVDGDMVDLDAALGQQFFDIAVGGCSGGTSGPRA